MFEQAFKNIDNILRKDAGVSNELDYVEQTSWLLFLKYLEELEKEKSLTAKLNGKKYQPIIDKKFTWSSWAYPAKQDGSLDHSKALTGDDLKDFIDKELFPYLKSFKQKAINVDTIEYKIGEIFGEIKNKIQSGHSIREVIDKINELHFKSTKDKHELSSLYEDKIQNMGNTGRNGGEYYTPRPLIRAIIQTVKPKIGQTIYDGAVGSAGFLIEAFEYLKNSVKLSVSQSNKLQKETLYGMEKKPLPYIIAVMNMILHGIETPNIVHSNTLSENIMDLEEKDKFDIIIANPPFGGSEKAEVQQNFTIKTSETAYLFLQHFMKKLKAGGSAGIVIKNTFLSNGDAKELRKSLIESCNLYAVLDLPAKVFTAGVKTVVLFFKKGEPTKKIWYYQLNLDRNLGKTNPLNDNDLKEFLELQKGFKKSENSWFVNVKDINQETFDLSVKNPNQSDEIIYKEPEQIVKEIQSLDEQSAKLLKTIKELL